MTRPIDIILNFIKTGRGDTQALDAMKRLDSSSEKLETTQTKLTRSLKDQPNLWANVAGGLYVAQTAFSAVTGAAQVAYGTLKEGAALNAAEAQFTRLAASIDTTADSLLNNLRSATKGMVSDAELITGATDIINLGLGKTEEETVRLATAVSTLGLDMQQVILTFANNSKARLDALGLSVEGVTEQAKLLEAQGFTGDAFDEAVLIGLEEKMELLGDASETTAGQLAILESSWANLTTAGKKYFAEVAAPVVSAVAEQVDELGILNDALERGIITQGEYNKAVFVQTGEQRAPLIEEINREIAAREELSKVAQQWADTADNLIRQYDEFVPANRNVYDGLETTAEQLEYLALAANDYLSAGEQAVITTEDLAAAEQRRAEILAQETAAQEAATAAQEAAAAAAAQLEAQQAGYFQQAVDGAISTDEWAQSLYDAAGAAGASAEELAALGVGLGILNEEQANAALNAAIVQTKIQELAQAYNNGRISVTGMKDELTGFIAELQNTPERSFVPDTTAENEALVTTSERLLATEDGVVRLTDAQVLANEQTEAMTTHATDLTETLGETTIGLESGAVAVLDYESALQAANTAVGQLTESAYSLNAAIDQVNSRTIGPSVSAAASNIPSGFAAGGIVGGTPAAGIPGNDNTLAFLRVGEYVTRDTSVNASTLPYLRYINAYGRPPGFAEGGMVGGDNGAGAPVTINVSPTITITGDNAQQAANTILDQLQEAVESIGVRYG